MSKKSYIMKQAEKRVGERLNAYHLELMEQARQERLKVALAPAHAILEMLENAGYPGACLRLINDEWYCRELPDLQTYRRLGRTLEEAAKSISRC